MTTDELAVEPAVAADAVIVEETPSAPSEEVKQEDAAKPDTEDGEAKPEIKEPTEAEKIKAQMQKRIDKLTAKAAQRESDYQAAQAKLNQLQQPAKDDAPKEADFDTVEEYLVAKGRHEERQESAAKQAAKAKEESEAAYKAKIEAKRQDFTAKEAAFRKDTPDYDDAVDVLNEFVDTADHRSPAFQAFRDGLMSAPDLPALSYHLGKNPDLVESMMKMEPAQVLWTLVETAYTLKSTDPKPPVKAQPSPPKPVGGSAKADKAIADMSGADILKWAGIKYS